MEAFSLKVLPKMVQAIFWFLGYLRFSLPPLFCHTSRRGLQQGGHEADQKGASIAVRGRQLQRKIHILPLLVHYSNHTKRLAHKTQGLNTILTNYHKPLVPKARVFYYRLSQPLKV